MNKPIEWCPTTPDINKIPKNHPVIVSNNKRDIEVAHMSDCTVKQAYDAETLDMMDEDERNGVMVYERGTTSLSVYNTDELNIFSYWAYLPKSQLKGTPWEDSPFSVEG